MKLSVIALLFFFNSLALAQNYQNMSEQDMQNMMQQAQKMQACMQNIDQAKMQALGDKAKQVESEIKALCAKGERAKAEKKALKFAQEINNSPDVAAARKCGEMMRGIMPSMGFIDKSPKEKSGGHICDDM
ncbi:MAG TPA: hypothetical protein EYH06_02430 [Chromatiales bacterium]|nr:hypothetical protein [Thiotrichales bacterium]HIP67430.1 hypothetical protein [Chromatiales bacterium]